MPRYPLMFQNVLERSALSCDDDFLSNEMLLVSQHWSFFLAPSVTFANQGDSEDVPYDSSKHYSQLRVWAIFPSHNIAAYFLGRWADWHTHRWPLVVFRLVTSHSVQRDTSKWSSYLEAVDFQPVKPQPGVCLQFVVSWPHKLLTSAPQQVVNYLMKRVISSLQQDYTPLCLLLAHTYKELCVYVCVAGSANVRLGW